MVSTRSLFPAELLESDYQPQVVAYYFRQWTGFTMPFHTHNSMEIMYAIDGICRVELGGPGPCEPIILKKGEFILLDARVPHRLLVDEAAPCRMLNVEFRFKRRRTVYPSLRELASEDGAVASLLADAGSHLVLRDPEEVYYTLKSLVLELDRHAAKPANAGNPGSGEGSPSADGEGAMVYLLLAQLLIRIARLRDELAQSGSPQAEAYVKMAMDFLRQNYDRGIQVKDIASAVNLHPGYLQRLFKTQTGTTLMDYLTVLRMEKAKMLLTETDIPIIEICDYIGVGSRQYFHMLFKSCTGQTPSDYRKAVDKHKWNTSL